MKNISPYVNDYLYEHDSFFYVAVMKLLHSVDDTKLSNKLILRPIVEDMAALLEDKRGYSIIASLFVEKHNELVRFDSKVPNQHSKKDGNVRRAELCSYIIDSLVTTLLTFDTAKLLKSINYSRFTGAVCKFIVQGITISLTHRAYRSRFGVRTARGWKPTGS
jgi:hypothetical protein